MRLPLAFNLGNRTPSLDKYARLLNCFVEVKGDPKNGGTSRVIKRPALNSAYAAQAPGQALYAIPDALFSIADDELTVNPPTLAKAPNYTVQPTDSFISTAISPAVVLNVVDIYGVLAAGFNGNVTMRLASNPSHATLSGTTTVTASGGVATFSNLLINAGAKNYTLKASAPGISSATSNTFNVNTKFVFTGQPAPTDINTAFLAEVSIEDDAGTVDTTYTGAVTIKIGTNPGGGFLSGNLTVNAVAGIADFSNLQINKVGSGYTLTVSAEGFDDVSSDPFDIPTLPRISSASNLGVRRSAAFTGASTAATGVSWAIWARFASSTSNLQCSIGNFIVQIHPNTLMSCTAQGSGGSSVMSVSTGNIPQNYGNWGCFLISWNATATWTVYYNDTAIPFSLSGTPPATIDLTATVAGDKGHVFINTMCAGEHWFNQAYMDFSVLSNRRRFITAGGSKVYLGANGQNPTGSTPLVYAKLYAATPGANLGTGGAFDTVASFSNCTTSP